VRQCCDAVEASDAEERFRSEDVRVVRVCARRVTRRSVSDVGMYESCVCARCESRESREEGGVRQCCDAVEVSDAEERFRCGDVRVVRVCARRVEGVEEEGGVRQCCDAVEVSDAEERFRCGDVRVVRVCARRVEGVAGGGRRAAVLRRGRGE